MSILSFPGFAKSYPNAKIGFSQDAGQKKTICYFLKRMEVFDFIDYITPEVELAVYWIFTH